MHTKNTISHAKFIEGLQLVNVKTQEKAMKLNKKAYDGNSWNYTKYWRRIIHIFSFLLSKGK